MGFDEELIKHKIATEFLEAVISKRDGCKICGKFEYDENTVIEILQQLLLSITIPKDINNTESYVTQCASWLVKVVKNHYDKTYKPC